VRTYISTLEEDSPAEFTAGEAFSLPDSTNLVRSGQNRQQLGSFPAAFQSKGPAHVIDHYPRLSSPREKVHVASASSTFRDRTLLLLGSLSFNSCGPSFMTSEVNSSLKGSQPQSCVIDCRCRITKGIAQCQHPNHRILVPALHHATP
jgi:hypothetical protein